MYVGVTETDAVDSRAAGMFDALLDQDPLKEVSKVCGKLYESAKHSLMTETDWGSFVGYLLRVGVNTNWATEVEVINHFSLLIFLKI